jgi:hypothetical protein
MRCQNQNRESKINKIAVGINPLKRRVYTPDLLIHEYSFTWVLNDFHLICNKYDKRHFN